MVSPKVLIHEVLKKGTKKVQVKLFQYSQQIVCLTDVLTKSESDHDTESGHELPTSQETISYLAKPFDRTE